MNQGLPFALGAAALIALVGVVERPGFLSDSALQKSVADRVRGGRPTVLSECRLPLVPADARLVFYGGYEGDALSSASVGGPDQETNVIDVTIEPGIQPVYLVLSSYESMVWRLRGAAQRVASVAVSATKDDNRGHSASGVTGVPADKVSIMPPGCPNYGAAEGLSKRTAGEERTRSRGQSAITAFAGRMPDTVLSSYSAGEIFLPSGRVARAARGMAPLPAGFDAAMWRDAERYWPGGLVAVDPDMVTAAAPVARYEVLPSQMGLAQLLGEGAIERSERGYRIVRPIGHFPPSMGGAHSVTLVLASGVPMPAGDPVHSCILGDDGQPLLDEPAQSMVCSIR